MKTKWASGLVLGFLLTANSSGAARSSQDTTNNGLKTITVGVYDYAHAKPGLLLEAERAAAAILWKAGVEAVWLACSTNDASTPACASPEDPTHFTLRILPDSMASRWRPLMQEQLTFERLLGAVIAHELGHLLLGENVHTRAGLMSARWSHAELLAIECGLLAFSDGESKRMQMALAAGRRASGAKCPDASCGYSEAPEPKRRSTTPAEAQ